MDTISAKDARVLNKIADAIVHELEGRVFYLLDRESESSYILVWRKTSKNETLELRRKITFQELAELKNPKSIASDFYEEYRAYQEATKKENKK